MPQSDSPISSEATRAIDAALDRLGFASFRPGQREAIETLLTERRLLLVAPTGGGKSLIYQLPAVLLGRTTLVVSPLIALMHDQVGALTARNVRATYLSSSLSSAEQRQRLDGIRAGQFEIVYVAPERLSNSEFRSVAKSLRPPLVAIDEAHCISEWGHDFRPEYMRIGELLADCPDARVLACTATATPVVRDEIIARLGMPTDTPQVVRGFARPNLRLSVREAMSTADKQAEIETVLRQGLGDKDKPQGSAIIYSPTRAMCGDESARLQAKGWNADAYHAGMPGNKRAQIQERFTAGEIDIVVATNAFGMGIDRADVRTVIHLAPPGSVESYYQEVGRAGRDGEDAWGVLFTSSRDMPMRRQLLERPIGDTPVDPEVVEHKWNMFLDLMRWTEGGSCRHDAILRYFGDEAETLSGCGHCDVCLKLSGDGMAPTDNDDPEEVTLIVRKALSAVGRVHGRFGLGAAVAILRGKNDRRLVNSGLDKVPTFGILKEYSEPWLQSLLRRCVTAGWVSFHGQDRPVVALTVAGGAVMHAERPARLLLPQRNVVQRRGVQHPKTVTAGDVTLDATASALFEALRSMRTTLARQAAVPPYVVASDRTLRDIALLRPRNLEELKLAHGIGPTKAERYGPDMLGIVSSMN